MNTADTTLRQTWVAVEGADGRTRMESRWVLTPALTSALTSAPAAVAPPVVVPHAA